MCVLHLFVVVVVGLLFVGGPAPVLAYRPTQHGVLLPIGPYQVELAVQGTSAFRVSVAINTVPIQIDSPIVAPVSSFAAFNIVAAGSTVGLTTSFGSVNMDSTSSFFALRDAKGVLLTHGQLPPGALRLHSRQLGHCELHPAEQLVGPADGACRLHHKQQIPTVTLSTWVTLRSSQYQPGNRAAG